MVTTVAIPRLSVNTGSVMLAQWYEHDGASVSIGTPLLRIETDNVAFDIEAEADGVLRQRARSGGTYETGECVAFLLAIGERLPDSPWENPTDADPARAVESLQPEANDTRAPTAPNRQAGAAPRLLKALDRRGKRSSGTAILPLREAAFDSAAEPDFPPDSRLTFDPPAARPPVPEAVELEIHDVTHDWDAPRLFIHEQRHSESALAEGTAHATSDPRSPSQTLRLRARVNFAEVQKLCAQLAKEWRAEGLKPDAEDVVVRAFAIALEAANPGMPLAGVRLRRLTAAGETTHFVPRASTRPFHEAVAGRARKSDAPEEVHPGAASSPGVVSFANLGIQDGDVRLGAGETTALAFGAVISVPVREGARTVNAPFVMLTLAADGEAMGEQAAAVLLARIRELLEAPYTLFAA